MFVFFTLFLPFGTHAMTISPLKQTVVIDPGQEQTVHLEIKNDTEKNIVVFSEIEAFSIDQKTGGPVFGSSDEAVQWIRAEQASQALAPREQHALTFTIRVPKGTPPGGHYLGLFANERAGDGQIGVAARTGSLLFLFVGGEATELLAIENFSPILTVWWSPPARFFLQAINMGTVHVAPHGRISTRNMFLQAHAQTAEIPHDRIVLPNERWTTEVALPYISWKDIGRNRATAYIIYGTTNQRVRADVVFWYMPLYIVIPFFLIFFIVVFSSFLIYKKYNRNF